MLLPLTQVQPTTLCSFCSILKEVLFPPLSYFIQVYCKGVNLISLQATRRNENNIKGQRYCKLTNFIYTPFAPHKIFKSGLAFSDGTKIIKLVSTKSANHKKWYVFSNATNPLCNLFKQVSADWEPIECAEASFFLAIYDKKKQRNGMSKSPFTYTMCLYSFTFSGRPPFVNTSF